MTDNEQKTFEPVSFAGGVLDRYRHVCAFVNSRDEGHRILDPFLSGGLAPGGPVSTAIDAVELAGFTSAETVRLTALRDCCTLIEFLDANKVQQVAFLKWRYDNGRLGGATADDEG